MGRTEVWRNECRKIARLYMSYSRVSSYTHFYWCCAHDRSYIPESRVAIVCSARSSHTKALGTTNLLLQASREALQPPSARPASGTQTPFFPKRVGSGFFGAREGREKDGRDPMMSSITSLSQLDIRSSSPSPFTPSSSFMGRPRSPSSPYTPGPNVSESSAFHETVEVIKRGHLEAARKCLRAGPLRDELEEEIERDCEALREFLYAAQVGCTVIPVSCFSLI